MDGRRRPGSFGRTPGAFASGGSVGASASGLRPSRPSSAPRRLGSGLDLPGGSHSHGWGKERRHLGSGSHGLARQVSAPSLAANVNQSMSFESSFARPPSHGVGGYDSFARSPGLRRSASATTVGQRNAPGLRYDNPTAFVTPEREFGGSRVGPSLGSSFPQRSDALQLESRLTERLREHSMSATEGATRRGLGGTRARAGSSSWPNQSWQEDSFGQHSGYQPPNMRFSSHLSHYDQRNSPNLDGSRGQFMPPSTSTPSMSPQMEALGSRGQHRSLAAHREDSYTMGGGSMTPPHSHHRTDLSMTGLGESACLPESRLKIYSDLFEEVIERDRVFGSLLRKIKTAYDTLLLRQPAVPPLPMDGVSSHMTHGDIDQHGWVNQDPRVPGGLHSNEPTTRAEGGQTWEMQRENRVLKDLVERLHLELEEAVRREHRWKQKVTKLKAKAETADVRQMQFQGLAHGYSMTLDDSRLQQGHLQKMPSDYHVQHAAHLQHDEISDSKAAVNSGVPRFHASRREPTLGEPEPQEGPLNQGGLLSISSISPQTSVPPFPMETGQEYIESARSTDSGMLPQRPPMFGRDRPAHVPRLDFSRLKEQLEEDEEEDDMEAEGQDDRGSDYSEDPKKSDALLPMLEGGGMSLDEAIRSLPREMRTSLQSDNFTRDCMDAFSRLDVHCNGALDPVDLIPLILQLCEGHPIAMDYDSCMRLTQAFDKDKNGVVTLYEFADLCRFVIVMGYLQFTKEYLENSGMSDDVAMKLMMDRGSDRSN